MTTKPDLHLVAPTKISDAVTFAAPDEGLSQENSRLRTLVVQLSAIIAKNVLPGK